MRGKRRSSYLLSLMIGKYCMALFGMLLSFGMRSSTHLILFIILYGLPWMSVGRGVVN
jgi:hypothetical protein